MSKVSTKKKTTVTLNAITMRYVLSAVLMLMLTGMAASFYFAYTMLHDAATEAANKQAELKSIDTKISRLDKLKEDLVRHKQSVERAEKIAANTKSYQYQNQVIDDLKFYATTAGVSIESFTFKEAATGTTAQANPPASSAPNSPAAPNAGNTQGPAGAAPKSTQVSIQLGRNIGYTNLLHFLHLIEKNLTRMQITDLSLAHGENNTSVSVQTLTLEVYIR